MVYFFAFQQNFAAQYDGVKAPDPGPGPIVRTPQDTQHSHMNRPTHKHSPISVQTLAHISRQPHYTMFTFILNIDSSPDTVYLMLMTKNTLLLMMNH